MENKKLNFGCGKDIRKGWDNVDIQKGVEVFKSFNFNIFPYPLKENSYDYVLVNQVLSYLNPRKTLFELHRLCKPDAIIHIEVPYYNNKGAFNDMEHLHYFSDLTFKILANDPEMIDDINKFEIIKLELIPTIVGKFIYFKWLREKLALFFGGLISQVHVDLRVIK